MSYAHPISVRIEMVDGWPEHIFQCPDCAGDGRHTHPECSCRGTEVLRVEWCDCAECQCRQEERQLEVNAADIAAGEEAEEKRRNEERDEEADWYHYRTHGPRLSND